MTRDRRKLNSKDCERCQDDVKKSTKQKLVSFTVRQFSWYLFEKPYHKPKSSISKFKIASHFDQLISEDLKEKF